MLPPDQLRLISCLLISIPLSFFMSTIHKPSKLLSFTCIVTIIFHSYLFGFEALGLWLQQHIVYFICKFGPRKRAGFIVSIETFMFLFAVQIRRMIMSYGEENYDITAVLMMQVFNYIGFAYNYQDGLDSEKHTERTIFKLPSYK